MTRHNKGHRKSHCYMGHALVGHNLMIRIKRNGYVAHECRTCRCASAARSYHRRKGKADGASHLRRHGKRVGAEG
jgi:uncharacterized protein YacL (UPF0231 family)